MIVKRTAKFSIAKLSQPDTNIKNKHKMLETCDIYL